MKLGFILPFLMMPILAAYSVEQKTSEELQDEVIDYSNIQKVLKKDGLEKSAKLKRKIVQQIKVEKEKIKVEKYNRRLP